MVDLNNGMSVVIADVVNAYWPKKFIQLSVMLVPTVGAPSPDPDTIDKYGVNYSVYFALANPDEKATCQALLGANIATIRQWILAEWQKYKADPATANGQLIAIFNYVASIGVKP